MLLVPLILYCLIQCLILQSQQADLVVKCCDKDSEVRIEEYNNTLTCVNSQKSRYQVLSNETNYLNTGESGECIDAVGKKFYRFNVNGLDNAVKSKEILNVPVFPKCCPLEHYYDKEKRSCLLMENATENYILSQFVIVGLPHCKMITDSQFENFLYASSVAKNDRSGAFCFDQNLDDGFVLRQCHEGLDICKKRRCFKKCCPDGQSFVGGAFCTDTYVHGVKIKEHHYSPYIEDIDNDYEFIYGAACKRFTLLKGNAYQYRIKKDGSFKYFYNLTSKFVEKPYHDLNTYCMEHGSKNGISDYNMFWCASEPRLEDKFALTLWAKILSCVCLFTTAIVYFVLGEHKSTFGKILINYCIAMTGLMVVLTISHLSRDFSRTECKITAYLLIFLNISAFAWVNIMSMDIWCIFGTPRRTIGSNQKRKDMKKLLIYLLYGWGVPLCHSLLILTFDMTRVLPESIQPYLGIYKCFMENRNYSKTVFFLVPQLILQIINIVLFIKTIVYCIRVKNEIKRMNDSARSGKYNADKGRLILVVKLAVIMGVVWTCEVTTAFFENMRTYSNFTKNLEIVMDNFTCLQGVFIFLIFICKKRTTNIIKNKLGLGPRKVSGSVSVTQTSHLNGNFPIQKRQTTMSFSEAKL